MSTINQIEIRRGTANGEISTEVFDLAGGGGNGSVAYGWVETSPVDGVAIAKLAPECDSFSFDLDKILIIRFVDNISFDNGGQNLKLLIQNSQGTQVEAAHKIYKQYNSQTTGLPNNSIFADTCVTFLCRQNSSEKQYYQISDNYVPHMGSLGEIRFI